MDCSCRNLASSWGRSGALESDRAEEKDSSDRASWGFESRPSSAHVSCCSGGSATASERWHVIRNALCSQQQPAVSGQQQGQSAAASGQRATAGAVSSQQSAVTPLPWEESSRRPCRVLGTVSWMWFLIRASNTSSFCRMPDTSHSSGKT